MDYLFMVEDDVDTYKLHMYSKSVQKGVKRIRNNQQKQTLLEKTAFLKEYDELQRGLLPILLKLLTQESERFSSEQTLEILSMVCYDPEFLIGRPCDHYQLDKISKNDTTTYPFVQDSDKKEKYSYDDYKELATEFYKELEEYKRQVRLFDIYVKRGTKELDRSSIQILSDQTFNIIKTKIENYYRIYWDHLTWNPSITCDARITVDENLLQHCCTNLWLLPLAHIILTRDAQYQIMGRKKYKKQELLSVSGRSIFDKFFSGKKEISAQEKHEISKQSLTLSLQIRDVLCQQLKGEQIENITNKLHSAATKEITKNYNQKKDQWPHSLSQVDLYMNYQHEIKKVEKLSNENRPFQMLNVDGKSIAILISAAYGMNAEEIDHTNALLHIFWTEAKTIDVFKKAGIDIKQESINGKHVSLEESLNAIKRLVLPKNYYSQSTTEGLLKNLTPAFNTICRAGILNSNEIKGVSAKQFYKGISKIIRFEDLTLIGLWLSRAMSVDGISKRELPTFLKHCRANLDDSLWWYLKFQNIRSIMGGEENVPGSKKELEAKDTRMLRYEISSKMNWMRACEFLNYNIVEPWNLSKNERYKRQVETMKNYWGNLKELANLQNDPAIMYAAFFQTTYEAIKILEEKVLEKLILLSDSLRSKESNTKN